MIEQRNVRKREYLFEKKEDKTFFESQHYTQE